MLMVYLQMIETEEDQQLFIYLYSHHKQQMQRVAYNILHIKDLSEDAVHTAFIGVANNMKALHGRSKEDMKNYLLKASKNAAINMLKKEQKQEEYYCVLEYDSTENSVLEELCAKMELEAIITCISRIQEPYHTVLYYHFVLHMTYQEIASALQRKPDAIRQQISRGKKMLKSLLEEALSVHV